MRNGLVDQQDLPRWLSLVEKRELRVGIIGLGYVGLPLVLLFSQEGFALPALTSMQPRSTGSTPVNPTFIVSIRNRSRLPRKRVFAQPPISLRLVESMPF